MTQYVRGWFGWLFVLGMAGATSIVSLPASANIPNALQLCIPRRQVARAEMVGSTQVQGKTYYLLAAYEKSDPNGHDLVIAVRDGRCEQSLYNPMGDPIALSSRIPQAAARQLTPQNRHLHTRRYNL